MSLLDTLVYHYLNESGYKKAAKELKRQGCSTKHVDITLEDVVESYNQGKKLKKLFTILAAEDSDASNSESGVETESVYLMSPKKDSNKVSLLLFFYLLFVLPILL